MDQPAGCETVRKVPAPPGPPHKKHAMTKVLLADDHAIVREGLRILIGGLFPGCLVDESTDGTSTFALVREHEYSLIILDIIMPRTDSFSLLRNILSVKPGSRILILSMSPEEVFAKKYLVAGALGYISKSAPEAELRQAIMNVAAGKRYLSLTVISQILLHGSTSEDPQNPFLKLSSRELEVTRHLIRGASSKEICSLLNIQDSTVATYKARILEKLGCRTIIDVHQMASVYEFN